MKLTQQLPVIGKKIVYSDKVVLKIIPSGHVIQCISDLLKHHVSTIIKRKEAPNSDEAYHGYSLLCMYDKQMEEFFPYAHQ
ncbi:hypothetical protein WQ54_11305 [Bacillus sp. SA1-12]|uniref:hypothetical protein n=1 Tax=Bacillus sp. SA1-12 TaxID=1455638 RepID=UPI000625790C|nr:hypothetical protein [Bacillus sp. SA1-12]KKI92026.1 hypothetical protein WQ54_11305 [Bacillus sp. SA1-12]